MSTDKYNTHGTPGDNEEADTASGGAPERMDGDEPRDGADNKQHSSAEDRSEPEGTAAGSEER